ncbi:MAG: DUF4149 domain-containing protein [Candidatus Sericytochromatia bacterium]
MQNIQELNSKNNILNKQLNIFLNIFSLIPISIVVFGILILGAIVAPTIFREITPRALASETMTNIFGRYFSVSIILVSVSILIEFIRLFITKNMSKLSITRFLLAGFIFLSTYYTANFIYPQIDKMRIENTTPTLWNNTEFVKLHKLSESLGKLSFGFGVFYFLIIIAKKDTN